MSKRGSNSIMKVEMLGETFCIYFSSHCLEDRCIERGVEPTAIAALVVSLGHRLLDLKVSECKEFTIFDDILKEGAVCSMDYNTDENIYEIDVITVLRTDNVWVRRGQTILKYSECVKFDK